MCTGGGRAVCCYDTGVPIYKGACGTHARGWIQATACFNNLEKGTVSIKDFGTTGVVSFARGCPFINMSSGTLTVNKKRIVVKREYLDTIQFHIGELVKKI